MKLHLAFTFALVAGCVRTGPDPIRPPPDATDGAPRASCQDACRTLVSLGCPEGQPTPGGRSCVDVCQTAFDFSGGSEFGSQLACIVSVRDLGSLHSCGVLCNIPPPLP